VGPGQVSGAKSVHLCNLKIAPRILIHHIGKFLYNNYKQALRIINEFTPTVEELKTQLKISDSDFERWNAEEAEYLGNLAKEPDFDIQSTAYVEALQSLSAAEYV
jgi:hypothetical protein